MSVNIDKIWKDMVISSKLFVSGVGIVISGINFYNCFASKGNIIPSPEFTRAPGK